MEDMKVFLEAPIEVHEETTKLREKASKVIDLPVDSKKQPDLLYFSAIFVSSGKNLNNAFFAGSELVAAEDTIVNKALDVEHSETEIIGHIYERVYIDKDGNSLSINELASTENASLDQKDMHIAIAGIIYKTRFPNIAQEVAENKWKVSMECFYSDYDIKIGDLVLNHREAEALGLASKESSILGKVAKVIKGGVEVAEGEIARVLRGICFSGCGIVKNPANPTSVILETAKEKVNHSLNDDVIILDYDKTEVSNNITSEELEPVEKTKNKEDATDGNLDDSVGICVNYKRRVEDKEGNILNNDWCSMFDKGCTSFSRDTTDPDCLRVKSINSLALATWKRLEKEKAAKDKRLVLLDGLKAALREAVKTKSR